MLQLAPVQCVGSDHAVQYEEPTEAIQTIRERLEVQRMLRCAWLRGEPPV